MLIVTFFGADIFPSGKRMARARARRKQWKLISGAMLVHCTLQALSLAIILRVYKTDARFASGAHLGELQSNLRAGHLLCPSHTLADVTWLPMAVPVDKLRQQGSRYRPYMGGPFGNPCLHECRH